MTEQPTPEQVREVLEAAWFKIYGERPCLVGQELHTWLTAYLPFSKMLDAEAFLSAAEMLVPEGWNGSIDWIDGSFSAVLNRTPFAKHAIIGNGATLALALAAAALRAHKGEG